MKEIQGRKDIVTQDAGENRGARLDLMQVAEFSGDGPGRRDLPRAERTDPVPVRVESGQEISPRAEPHAMRFSGLSGEGAIVPADADTMRGIGRGG